MQTQFARLTQKAPSDILSLRSFDLRQEGNRWRLAFHLFIQKEVGVMTDFEMISIFIMILMLVFAVLDYSKKDDK